MNNVIYSELVLEAGKSLNIETPTKVTVTEEVNCFAVWFESHDFEHLLHLERYSKMGAIKKGVELAQLPEEKLLTMRWAG